MKLQIKRGLPGSGKTTAAYRVMAESGNTGRINRDDLRAMLFQSRWTSAREAIVVDCEKAIMQVLFQHKHNVVLDDTNLSDRHVKMWQEEAKRIGFVNINVDKLDTDLVTCVRRDELRLKRVGKAIIHRMALFNGLIDFGEKPIVIVDIDGTIADGTHTVRSTLKVRIRIGKSILGCVIETSQLSLS